MPSSNSLVAASYILYQLCRLHSNNEAFLSIRGVLADLDDLEPTLSRESFPLSLGALLSPKLAHHGHVHKRGFPRSLLLRQDHVINQKVRALSHGIFKMSENLNSLVIGPVMENRSEIVRPCSCFTFSRS